MEIIFNIEQLLFGIADRLIKNNKEAKKKKAAISKTLKQFINELHEGRAITSELLNGKKLSALKANDPGFKSILTTIKTTAMKAVRDYSEDYEKLITKNNKEFFDTLSIAIYKIDRLKKLSKMNEGQLSLIPSINLTSRIQNINRCFIKLIKEAGKK